jgi:mRNA interferase RelE/StbE
VIDQEITVVVVAIGKREREQAYRIAGERLSE